MKRYIVEWRVNSVWNMTASLMSKRRAIAWANQLIDAKVQKHPFAKRDVRILPIIVGKPMKF